MQENRLHQGFSKNAKIEAIAILPAIASEDGGQASTKQPRSGSEKEEEFFLASQPSSNAIAAHNIYNLYTTGLKNLQSAGPAAA